MENYVFIAEKPSLMREVKACYQKHREEINHAVGTIDFTALAGHVCRYMEPDEYGDWSEAWESISYPMIPKQWGIVPIKGKEAILETIDNWHKYMTESLWGLTLIRKGTGSIIC